MNKISTVLIKGEEDELTCIGYKRDTFKSIFSHIISILLAGVPYLIGYWKPNWSIKWFRSKCPLFLADSVILEEITTGQIISEYNFFTNEKNLTDFCPST